VFPAGVSAALIANLQQQFNNTKQAFQTFNAINLALKKELLAATDEIFVLSLHDRTHGFALVPTCTISVHLHANYEAILSVDLSTHNEFMHSHGLFAQINDVMQHTPQPVPQPTMTLNLSALDTT
jgi:hypothetical protein